MIALRRPFRSEGGFTLIELLVAIIVLGIIAVPLSAVVINYLLNTARTSSRLDETSDEQIATAYWQQDVASVGVRGAYDAVTGTFPFQAAGSVNLAYPCAAPSGTQVLTLAWNAYDSAGTATKRTVYYGTQNAGATLVRAQCVTTSSGSTGTAAVMLMRNLSGAPTCNFGSGFGACSAGSGTPSAISITLHVDASGTGQAYNVTLSGQRRQT
jgi:prepilin-type N-terminal cleavage/methylation domain-containing protein